jgi:type I restriction enzyme, S subunit
MSFPRYPEYKDSGVEWLGEVPAHWETWKVCHAFSSIGSGTTPPSDEPQWYEDGTIPWITTGELRENVVTETTKSVTPEALARFSALRLHPVGSLAVAMYGATIGRLGILGIPATTNQACCVLSSPKHLDVRFVFYWLYGSKQNLIDLYATGGGQPNINQDIIAGLRIPAPTVAEQSAIATFLDHETAKIDALVAEQEKLIALLKEKRQAVISHAVTKGLNPDAPMKDSGIEWLGEVPAHWDVTRVKRFVLSFGQGWSPQCEGYPVETDEEWGVLKVGCVNNGRFNPAENKTLPPELEPPADLGIAADDLLISRANTRELVGSAAVAENAYPRLLLCDKLYRVRFNQALCIPRFLALYLGSDVARSRIELAATGASSSMVNISQSTILEMPIAVPDANEQRTIAEFAGEEIGRLVALTTQAEAAITLLKERRSALISAAVTGKIDVREFA